MEALPYRIIFEQLHNGHPWNALENDEFLMKLRAVAKNKKGSLYPTTAGLLFFGEAYHITDVFPNYFLDYREEKVMKASQRKKQWNCVNIPDTIKGLSDTYWILVAIIAHLLDTYYHTDLMQGLLT